MNAAISVEEKSIPRTWLTRRELAQMLGVTERHIINLDRRGVFRPVRLGAAVRYSQAEVDAALALNRAQPPVRRGSVAGREPQRKRKK